MIVEIKGHKIELFETTQDLPILRFQKFNKYIMIANEVGNTFEDYDQRTVKALSFLQKEMVPEAIQELSNRRQTVFNAFNEFSPKSKAFAVLIKRIDGTYYDGYSPGELDKVLKHLDRIGLSYINSMEALNDVKKKIETELQVYFPTYFPKNGNINHTALRLRRINQLMDGLIEEKDIETVVYGIEKEILEQDKPNVWNVYVEGNMERVLEVDFHKFAVSVVELTGMDINKITTFTFYASVEHLKEKHKAK